MSKHHTPFKHLLAFFADIEDIGRTYGAGSALASTMVAGREPYRSRGKGHGGVFMGSSSRCVAHDKRDARKARNRRKEKARRWKSE